jgi:hypothetical protein
MKKFIRKSILFILATSISITAIAAFMTYCTDYYRLYDGSEIYRSINKSKKKKKVKKLLLGESVANQLYNNRTYNDSIYSLACNQAISVAGHYFLLKNFIEANKEEKPDEVILFYNPLCFGNQLDRYAFHYFLKPFYTEEYKPLMNDYLLSRIKHIPCYYTAQFWVIKTSNWSPEYSLYNEEGLFSCVSKSYLEKIYGLCMQNQIRFRLEPTPVANSKKNTVMNYSKHIKYVPTVDTVLINNYIQHYRFFEDSLFSDGSHLKSQHIPKDYLKLAHDIEKLQSLQ